MNTAIQILLREISQCECTREVLQEGHPRIIRLNERIAEIKLAIEALGLAQEEQDDA